MLKQLREFKESCALDRERRSPATGTLAEAHRALVESAPPVVPAPAGLRARVMSRIYDADLRPVVHGVWRLPLAGALAAALVLAIGGALYLGRPTRPQASPTIASDLIRVPVDAGPMLRLVANSVDEPLKDQAQKLMADTRRATRIVARCLPFAPGE